MKFVALGDVVNLLNGRAYKKEELLNKGKYKVLRVGNLFTSDKWYFSNLELDKDKYCNKGDLLYAWSASFGPHYWSEDNTIYHYHIWKLQFDENVIDKDFLYFWLLYDKEKIKKASGTGTTMMHVSKTSMEKRRLILPPIEEQKKIVERLNKIFEFIDNKVGKETNLIDFYKKLYKSKLNQIFSDEFMKSGETSLGELSKIISGQSPKGEFINESEGLEFHQGKKAFSDKFLLDSGKRTEFITKQIPKNTIVMSVRAPVGPVNITQKNICIGRGLAGIIPEDSNLNFLFYYLDFIKEENTGHVGATINSINRNEIMKIKIPNLKTAKQERIANQIEQILELKNELSSNSRKTLIKLNQLKESILEKEFAYE